VEGSNFDLVIISHVLEHLKNPQDLLQKAKSALGPNGVVLIEVPHKDYWYKIDVYGHVLFFGADQLRRLGERVGFSICDVSVYGKGAEQTPMNPKSNPLIKWVDTGVYRGRRILPFSVMSAYYRWSYGIDQKNPNGTWIRAVFKRGHT
jgi:SAM-dependent methyltransferase